MEEKVIYISGPMTGEPNYRNIFKKHEDALVSLGNKVFNPVYLSDYLIASHHIDEKTAWTEEMRGFFLKEDIKALLQCDSIYMIPGWEFSRGATFEKEVAEKCGMKVIYGMEL